MNYIYTAVLEPQESGSYFVTVPDLPQVATRGADLKDALDMGNDALALWLTYAEEQGLAVPKATPPGVIKAEAPAFTTLLEADTDAYRRAYPPETGHDQRAV